MYTKVSKGTSLISDNIIKLPLLKYFYLVQKGFYGSKLKLILIFK